MRLPGDLPTDGHALEDFVLEDEIASVVALRKITVFVERLRAHRMADDVVLDVSRVKSRPGIAARPLTQS